MDFAATACSEGRPDAGTFSTAAPVIDALKAWLLLGISGWTLLITTLKNAHCSEGGIIHNG
jgi:hypothetical protein